MEAVSVTRAAWLLAVMLVPSMAHAQDLFVDADSGCPGDGTAGAPFCELLPALEAAAPGDRVLLRESEDPYAGVATTASVASGTAGQPIVLEPAPGEAPIVGGAMVFDNVSHWTIRGLTVDLRDVSASPGIDVRSTTQAAVGVRVEGNTVLQSAGPGIRLGSFDDLTAQDVVLRGNFVRGAVGSGIQIIRSANAAVLANVVEDVTCSGGQFKLQSGIAVIFENDGTELAGNTIRALRECEDGPSMNHVQGIRIRSSSDGTIHDNLVEVEAPGGGNFVGGISIHEESTDWLVHHNVVRGTSGCGLCDGEDFGSAERTIWAHNTVVGTDVAVGANESTDAVFAFNLLEGTQRAVELGGAAGNATFEQNLVSGVADVLAAGDAQSFEAFATDCGCDDGSVVADAALLEADGLTPGASSPAIDLATGSSYRASFNGRAADAGALEVPVPLSATIDDDGAGVILEVENAWAPPLQPNGCAGVELLRDGVLDVMLSCVAEHDQASGLSRLVIGVGTPMVRGEVAVLEVLPVATDSTSVGGMIAARVRPTSFELDTSELPEAGDDESSGGNAGSSSGTGEGVEGTTSTSAGSSSGETGVDGSGDSTGCGCAPSRPTHVPWLLLALLGLRRRRRIV